jgi:hypothetical protein
MESMAVAGNDGRSSYRLLRESKGSEASRDEKREKIARGGDYASDCPNRGGEDPLTCGPWPTARGRGRGEEQGHVGQPGGKRSGSGPKKQWNFLIYSNNFQMSSNCFDQKVDLPRSKNFKSNMYLKGIK